MAKLIPLHGKYGEGKFAIVDDEDYERVVVYRWRAKPVINGRYYALACTEESHDMSLHRFVLRAQPGQLVDHKNGNGLDNTKENIRFATYSQNGTNRMKSKTNHSSKYKGVAWNKSRKKWQAKINNTHLGWYAQEVDAAKTYDEAAKQAYGEFSCLNFP